ncbi:MAG: RnfABCDGE type electron transport complex subunit C [Desulfobacterales bacterium]
MGSARMRGGVDLPLAAEGFSRPFEPLPLPPRLILPLIQDEGGLLEPKVKKNETVRAGQVIAENPRPHMASLHAPAAGKVVEIATAFRDTLGRVVPAVVIEPDGSTGQPEPPPATDPASRVAAQGLVDFDRRAQPLAAKLQDAAGRQIETLIVNALDQEPFLFSRSRLIQEEGRALLQGIESLQKTLSPGKTVVVVESRAPEVRRAAAALTGGTTHVFPLANRYPQAAPRMLARAVLGAEIPYTAGVTVADIGGLIVDVEAAVAAGRGGPLTERYLTVSDGRGNRHNVRVALGTPIGFILERCGIALEPGGKIVAGGPMSGPAVADPGLPVTKETAGIFVQGAPEVTRPAEAVCIKCGLCVEKCPMRLMPFLIAGFAEKCRFDEAERYDLFACIECGCCAYLCPAGIPLLQFIRFGKQQILGRRKGA